MPALTIVGVALKEKINFLRVFSFDEVHRLFDSAYLNINPIS